MRKLLARCIIELAWFSTYGMNARKRALMLERIQDGLRTTKQTVDTETEGGTLRFSTPSRRLAQFALQGPKSEPDTAAWIERLPENAVLWDIGAHMGIFSLYAALRPGVRVLAFEPGAASYAILNRNIEINGMADRIRAYPITLAGSTRLDFLNMANTAAGGSMQGFGTERDQYGKVIRTTFRQAGVGFSIDDFVRLFSPPAPTHVKIDVDGIEAEILRGGRDTLSAPDVQGMIVEIQGDLDSAHNQEIYRLMNELGFRGRPKESPDYRNVIFDR
ncbi:MAG: FkbM family methyltransferase [Rhodospirillaceae bacterium]|nr:FkbM family methyltransferase [Rhodospirillaceae bacterium]MYB12690.1 FkbM family methyltransferase [Rhodospirillaceae bacterium]MYI49401.1 FkbM family methyltransferase [Rhodospirillaceae bacterium]